MADTPLTLAQKAADFLSDQGIENARYEAELLLASILGVGRLQLYLQHDRPLTPDEVEAFRNAVRRRLKHEPVQYIVGEVHFRELVLHVDPRVLIPRPETEVLVGEVLRWAEDREDTGSGPTAVDIGTGSGAIALSLLYEGPFDRVVATDASEDALEVAAENAERTGVADRIEFRRGPLWTPLGDDERFDVIVSNPPYVAEEERPDLPPEVRDWEPTAALVAPGGGLEMLEALVDGAAAHLRPEGLLALEVAPHQARPVASRIDRNGAYAASRIVQDFTGRERVVLARPG